MTLNLLVLVVREQVDQRMQESGIDDGRFVRRVDGDVSDAGGGGENEGKEGRTEKSKKRGKSTVLDDFELVFLCSRLSIPR